MGVSDHRGNGSTPPSRPAGPLLVVGHVWRNVPQGYPRQGADIDSHLHRRGTTEDVNRRFTVEGNILEPQLVLFYLVEGALVWLTGELGRVFSGGQAEWF